MDKRLGAQHADSLSVRARRKGKTEPIQIEENGKTVCGETATKVAARQTARIKTGQKSCMPAHGRKEPGQLLSSPYPAP
jgi:hypothetical protein